ncbi:hypothetical protein KVT40_008229 [Elsinoe batatas]|uniref:Uncharacterized protein n=1 Tax=Elsinoe batatas TaxID=2601811 RepID=A0A8K0KV80_9PEZI|nr:hypothetical protein KVT40_008229 [Elsinoe batatas]
MVPPRNHSLGTHASSSIGTHIDQIHLVTSSYLAYLQPRQKRSPPYIMPAHIRRTESLEHRLRHPNTPLTVRAQEYHIEGHESDGGSSFHTVTHSEDSTDPADEIATLLEREHRVNRIQAEENTQLRSEIRRLRGLAESMPAVDTEAGSPRTNPLRNAALENSELHGDNTKLQGRIKAYEKDIELKTRQIYELEDQLQSISIRLKETERALEARTRELDSYITPSADFHPVKTVSDIFHKMNVAELNAASLALGSAMSEARNKATQSSASLSAPGGTYYSGPRRPISALYEPRPQSAMGFPKENNVRGGAGVYTPAPTPLNSPIGSLSDGYTAVESPFEKKHIKWDDDEGKKRKGLFSGSKFWKK